MTRKSVNEKAARSGYWGANRFEENDFAASRDRSMNRCMRISAFAAAFQLLLTIAVASAGEPLRRDSTGHLLVPVLVNGTGPYPFIFDVGADRSAVYHAFATAHGLPKGHRGELSGAVGNEPEMTTRIDSLSLDGRAIRHVDVDTLPDRPDGAKIAGVAGVDFMMDRLVVMDTGCESVALLPVGTNPAGVAGVHASFVKAGAIHDGKQLTLPVWINGVKGMATLDTGARATMINRRFAHAAWIKPDSPVFKNGPAVRGATQQIIQSRIGPIGNIRFAAMTRNGVTARVVDLPMFDDAAWAGGPAMNLGLDLLHNTRLTVDYRQRKFWMAPSACAR